MSWRQNEQAPIRFTVFGVEWADWPRGAGLRIMVPDGQHFGPLVPKVLELGDGKWQALVTDGYMDEDRHWYGDAKFDYVLDGIVDVYRLVADIIRAEPQQGSWDIL